MASVQVGAQHAIESQTDCVCTKLGDACETLSFVGLNNLVHCETLYIPFCVHRRQTGDGVAE